MPGYLVFDEKSGSNRRHHMRAPNVMNEIMHPFSFMRDRNLNAGSHGGFLHGCPEANAAQGSHKIAKRFSSHRIFRAAQS